MTLPDTPARLANRERNRRYYERHKEEIKEKRAQWRRENQEQDLDHKRRWRRANQEKKTEYTRRYREENPLKHQAHAAVARAIRSGAMTRQPCEVCGSTERVQAHHEDYSKPLDVRWLCPKHHAEAHGRGV